MFPVNVSVRQLAELVQGQVEGEADLAITAARPLHEAQPGHITFLENPKKVELLEASRASAAVVGLETPTAGKTVIRVAQPQAAFVAIVQKLHARLMPAPGGIDPRAAVDPGARIGPDASIAAFASIAGGVVIGARCRVHSGVSIGRDCRLGDDVVLYPNAVLYDGTILGDRVIVHANAVLGADGFGYRQQQGKHVKIPQLGYVEIGADAEIGACTTIDRGTFGSTKIGAGTKIDNLVMVGHNCQIGNHVILVSQVGIAGSCTLGDYAVLGGQVGVADHMNIGAGAAVAGKGGVMRDVPPGAQMFGFPARPGREHLRMLASMDKVPDLWRDMQRVKKRLGLDDESKKRAG